VTVVRYKKRFLNFNIYTVDLDKALVSSFLVTFPYFISAKELMLKLKERYDVSFSMTFLPSPKDGVDLIPTEESNAKYRGVLHERYVNILCGNGPSEYLVYQISKSKVYQRSTSVIQIGVKLRC